MPNFQMHFTQLADWVPPRTRGTCQGWPVGLAAGWAQAITPRPRMQAGTAAVARRPKHTARSPRRPRVREGDDDKPPLFGTDGTSGKPPQPAEWLPVELELEACRPPSGKTADGSADTELE